MSLLSTRLDQRTTFILLRPSVFPFPRPGLGDWCLRYALRKKCLLLSLFCEGLFRIHHLDGEAEMDCKVDWPR